MRSDTVITVLYSKITVSTVFSAAGKAEIFPISHLLPVLREMFVKKCILFKPIERKFLSQRSFIYLTIVLLQDSLQSISSFPLRSFYVVLAEQSQLPGSELFYFHDHEQQERTTRLCLFGHCCRSEGKEEQDMTWILYAQTRASMLAWCLGWMSLPHKVVYRADSSGLLEVYLQSGLLLCLFFLSTQPPS